MSPEEAIECITTRFKYKDKYGLRALRPHSNDTVEVIISHSVRDIDDPFARGELPVIGTYEITAHALDLMTFVDFCKWVRGIVIEFEIHEIDEWLRIDGKFVYDPHPSMLRNRSITEKDRQAPAKPSGPFDDFCQIRDFVMKHVTNENAQDYYKKADSLLRLYSAGLFAPGAGQLIPIIYPETKEEEPPKKLEKRKGFRGYASPEEGNFDKFFKCDWD